MSRTFFSQSLGFIVTSLRTKEEARDLLAQNISILLETATALRLYSLLFNNNNDFHLAM